VSQPWRAGLRQALHALLALIVALIGGASFHALEWPLPWTLGSITSTAIVALAGFNWALPLFLRDLARPVIGLMAGSAFTATVVASMMHWWPALIVVLLYTLVTVALGMAYFRRVCRWNLPTSVFSASPGGLSELTLLGASLGGDIRTLALVHSVRIVVVVFSVPFALQFIVGHPIGRVLPGASGSLHTEWADWLILAGCGVLGYAIGRVFTVPGGVMLPALLLSAVAHATGLSEAYAPDWLVAAVQLIIGSAAGSRFNGITWKELRATLAHSVVWAFVLVILTATAAWLASIFLDHSVIALSLSFAPGGMAEMAIIAFTLGTDVAFVICCQVARILLVYLMVPMLFRIVRSAADPPGRA
jgi:membrane AbrB-like protein